MGEIQNIIKIMALQPKREYRTNKDLESLRYGSIMIMADQDYDGSHIKGLLINLIQHWWPSLHKREGFLKEFVTPIVKVSKGGECHQFFSMREFEQWKDKTPNAKSWSQKYYKGLGTSTTAEAKEYFKKISDHSLSFDFEDDKDDECIDLAFNKKRADDRKEWINECEDDSYVDHSADSVSYSDFVHKELVHFAKYDVMRSIPSIADGFKPSQRKVMYCIQAQLEERCESGTACWLCIRTLRIPSWRDLTSRNHRWACADIRRIEQCEFADTVRPVRYPPHGW